MESHARPGHFLAQTDYERRINRACQLFARKVASPWQHKFSGEHEMIYNLMRGHEPEPLTRGQIVKLLNPDWLNIDTYTWGNLNRHIHSRLQYLLARGLIYECGRVVDPYFTRAHHPPSSMSYRIVPLGEANVRRTQIARRVLYQTVARLNQKRERATQLMETAVVDTDRNAQILDFRQHGWTLREIGLRFGLTRERVRQILAKAYGLTPTTPPKPRGRPRIYPVGAPRRRPGRPVKRDHDLVPFDEGELS